MSKCLEFGLAEPSRDALCARSGPRDPLGVSDLANVHPAVAAARVGEAPRLNRRLGGRA